MGTQIVKCSGEHGIFRVGARKSKYGQGSQNKTSRPAAALKNTAGNHRMINRIKLRKYFGRLSPQDKTISWIFSFFGPLKLLRESGFREM